MTAWKESETWEDQNKCDVCHEYKVRKVCISCSNVVCLRCYTKTIYSFSAGKCKNPVILGRCNVCWENYVIPNVEYAELQIPPKTDYGGCTII